MKFTSSLLCGEGEINNVNGVVWLMKVRHIIMLKNDWGLDLPQGQKCN